MFQDLYRDLLCVPGHCGCARSWLCVPSRWQGEKWPARWPARTSVLPGTLMSGLPLFWDARLVTTSPWETVCLSPTKWIYMKKELARWFLQRILKSWRPRLIHKSQSHDSYYFFIFLGGHFFNCLDSLILFSPGHVEFTHCVSHVLAWCFKLIWQCQCSFQTPAREIVSRYLLHSPTYLSHSGWEQGWP